MLDSERKEVVNSKVYTGKLLHERLAPVKHRFEYPVYFFCFDLDELPEIARKIPCFGHNRFNLFSFYDGDYLQRGPGTLRGKLADLLRAQGLDIELKRIELVTTARFLGHVFNPASFFYVYDAAGQLRALVTQVNNTFGEMHVYTCIDPVWDGAARLYRGQSAKVFHVSPFFDRTGEYKFVVSHPGETVDLNVNLYREGKPALLAQMTGKARPLTSGSLFATLVRFPLSVFLTLPRIHWQAARLYFEKKLPAFKKPVPKSRMTLRMALPGFRQRLCMRLLLPFFERIQKGRLTLAFPDGTRRVFGGKHPGIEALIQIQHYDFFLRLARDAGIGLGEGYMEEDWETPDLTAVLNLLIENKPYLEHQNAFFEVLSRWINRGKHVLRKNTIHMSKKNIQEHYDLGNAFYEQFLDETWMYSCAVFVTPDEDLAQAQLRKLHMVIDKAQIGPDDHVLEVGCGWGGFALEAVRRTGCRVTGITLSEEQLKLASARVEEAGLSDRIEFKLCDYRHVTGHFDRIVSIEMLEAVGHEYFDDYFKTLDRLLKPGGRTVIQVITIPDDRYENYRLNCDFIQKHIFPGGHLPSLEALKESIGRASRFTLAGTEDIGPHYAETLRHWRMRFNAHRLAIKALGYPERLLRAWNYYFSYCEAGFDSRHIHNLQLILTQSSTPEILSHENQYAAR